jgi:replicative DNA helicase
LADLLHDTPADARTIAATGPPSENSGASIEDIAEHRRYAQMVLEASIRRQVEAMGSRISQATTEARVDPDRYITQIDTPQLVETLTRQLDQAATRLGELTDQLTLAGTDPPAPGWPTEIPALAAGPTRAHRAPGWSEHILIGACLTSPWLREIATARLVPDDLAHPTTATTWTTLRAMTEAGQPVDYVLLAARQLRDHATARGPDQTAPLRPTELAGLAQRSNTVAGCQALHQVNHTALLRAADRTQRMLATITSDPALEPGHLVGTAHQVLHRLRDDITRLGNDDGQDIAPPAATPAGPQTRIRRPQTRPHTGPAGPAQSPDGEATYRPSPPHAPLPAVGPARPGTTVTPTAPRRTR